MKYHMTSTDHLSWSFKFKTKDYCQTIKQKLQYCLWFCMERHHIL